MLKDLARKLLPGGGVLSKKGVGKASVALSLGGLLTRFVFDKKKAEIESLEPVLDSVNAYDLGKGAGRLLAAWLAYQNPADGVEAHVETLNALLARLDKLQPELSEQAQNRFLVSKVLFYLENFRLGRHVYEGFQAEAAVLLRKMPQWRHLSKKDVFLGKPFAVESLIGATHGMLLALTPEKKLKSLNQFLANYGETNPLREAADYYAQLIALTFPVGAGAEAGQNLDDALESVMLAWFEEFRLFQMNQVRRNEKWIHGTLALASGELPAITGAEVLRRVGKAFSASKSETPSQKEK